MKKSTTNETKVKSTNYMGQILYNYIQQRNEDIKTFNRYHFNRNLDGTYSPRPGCDYSEPLELIDWNDLVTTCNNANEQQVKKARDANKKVYAYYMQIMNDEVFSLVDEITGFELKW